MVYNYFIGYYSRKNEIDRDIIPDFYTHGQKVNAANIFITFIGYVL